MLAEAGDADGFAMTLLTQGTTTYVPVYRTPAATGGGWAFARWQ